MPTVGPISTAVSGWPKLRPPCHRPALTIATVPVAPASRDDAGAPATLIATRGPCVWTAFARPESKFASESRPAERARGTLSRIRNSKVISASSWALRSRAPDQGLRSEVPGRIDEAKDSPSAIAGEIDLNQKMIGTGHFIV